jgi:hypothetical protein
MSIDDLSTHHCQVNVVAYIVAGVAYVYGYIYDVPYNSYNLSKSIQIVEICWVANVHCSSKT